MEFSAEWMSVVIGAAVASGGLGAWIMKRIDAARHALPIIRTEWLSGTGGFTAQIEFVNRLNEDLHVTRADAKADFAINRYKYDTGGSIANSTIETQPSPMVLDWRVKAGETGKFSLGVSGAGTARWIRITMSSSSRTLRAKRLTLANSVKP